MLTARRVPLSPLNGATSRRSWHGKRWPFLAFEPMPLVLHLHGEEADIRERLTGTDSRKFILFHPSWCC